MTDTMPTLAAPAVTGDAGDTFAFGAVDPRIAYPSYKSFDEFIDVERLRALDGYLRRRIQRWVLGSTEAKFYTGPYRLDDKMSDRPGSRMIYLAQSDSPDSYFDLDRTDLWQPTEAANEFALLMEFIATLPFESTGRILVLYDDQPRDIPAHRDHVDSDVLHEFIWLRTSLKKKFYLLNCGTGEKLYVSGYSAWFDTVNQFHGCDGCDGLSYSVRVDGRFTDEFRAKIPRPGFNAASTPSFWASLSDHGEG